MNKIELNKLEFELFNRICSDDLQDVIINDELKEAVSITFSEEVAETISEKIKDSYVYEGFDKSYKLTKEGKVYESLIDKFYAIGW